nr:MAG TPA: hypothetical protein [Caudoviricetes sp.]
MSVSYHSLSGLSRENHKIFICVFLSVHGSNYSTAEIKKSIESLLGETLRCPTYPNTARNEG